MRRGVNLPLECYKKDDYTYIVEGFGNNTGGETLSVHLFLTLMNANPNIVVPFVEIFGTNNTDDLVSNILKRKDRV